MVQHSQQDYTHLLQQLMQQVGLSSFKSLGQAARVSDWQIQQLRRGNVGQMRLEVLVQIAQALQIPLTQLLTTFSSLDLESADGASDKVESREAIADLQQEYQRLQAKLQQQQQELWQEFQQSTLQVLESLLLFLPTADYHAQQNPEAPAKNVMPLLRRPIEQLLNQWGVEAIAAVGAEVIYDPRHHQLHKGTAQPGDRVKVTHVGYQQGDKLLHRVKVSAIS